MSLESGLRSYFQANAPLAAMLTADNLEGVQEFAFFPHEAPQSHDSDKPYIVYRMMDSDEARDLGGNLCSQKFDFEFECHSRQFDPMRELARRTREAVGGPLSTGVQTTLDGISVNMFWGSSPEHYGKISGDDGMRYFVSLDLTVFIRGGVALSGMTESIDTIPRGTEPPAVVESLSDEISGFFGMDEVGEDIEGS